MWRARAIVPLSIRNACAHYAHMHITLLTSQTRFSFFLVFFFHPVFFSWVAICQIARDAQLCDVTCLFSSSEKKAGINGFCLQEWNMTDTTQAFHEKRMNNSLLVLAPLPALCCVSYRWDYRRLDLGNIWKINLRSGTPLAYKRTK